MTHSFLKSVGPREYSLFRIAAYYSSDTASFDPIVIYLEDKATGDFDSQFDALKIFNTDIKSRIFTLSVLQARGCQLTLCQFLKPV